LKPLARANFWFSSAQDDPLLFDYNVEERVNDFVAAAVAQVHFFFLNTSTGTFSYQYFHLLCDALSLWLYTLQGDQ
jgi:hypothetical protein